MSNERWKRHWSITVREGCSMLFIRWDDLTDRVVGKTDGSLRPSVRWPKEIVAFKKVHNKSNAVAVTLLAGTLLALASVVGVMLRVVAKPLVIGFLGGSSITVIASTGVVGILLVLVGGLMVSGIKHGDFELDDRISDFIEPLYSKRPYLDLQLAAFFTMGAMPEWLRKRMIHGTWRGWPNAQRAKPYTVERAGLDYLELMNEIKHDPKKYMWCFHDELFPGCGYRLPDSLKAPVSEIILLLSSLPDSGEEPDEETMEAVISTIDRLAVIDGEESFTAAVRRSLTEKEKKRRDDYNSEIRRTLDTANSVLDAKTDAEADEGYKRVQRGIDRLSKISKEADLAAESAGSQRAEAVSLTR